MIAPSARDGRPAEPTVDRRRLARIGGTVLLVVAIAPFLVYAFPQVAGADASYVVLSSSMAPTIGAGDAVVVEAVPAEEIETGDVITFEPPGRDRASDAKTVTHRVVEVVHENGGPYFRTTGDANERPDRVLVPAENVEGRVVFAIPLVGRVVAFAQSPTGLVALVVVPAVLLAVTELRSLLRAGGADDEAATTDRGSEANSPDSNGRPP